MNEGIHLDLDTWIVPGQISKANLCRGLGNRYTPAGTEVLYIINNKRPLTPKNMPMVLYINTVYLGLDNGVEAYLRIYAYTTISVYVYFLLYVYTQYLVRIYCVYYVFGQAVGVLAVLCAFGSVDLWLSHG